MAIGPGPIGEVRAGLRQAWTDAKKSFKEARILPSIKEASKRVLSSAKDAATIAIHKLGEENGKGAVLLAKSAGLLAVNYGLASFTNWVGLHPGPNTAGVETLFAVTGLINGGIGAFTADKAVKFYQHMKSLKSK